MWVDNDVSTLKNFYRSPFSKWLPQYRTNSTLSDFNAISYVGYEMSLKSDNVECVRYYCGGHFENGDR
jgi:hypothetical protein